MKRDQDATALVLSNQTTALDAHSAAARLVETFLSRRKETTLRAYHQDLEDFRSFVGEETLGDAARVLLSRSNGEANALALSYRSQLEGRKLSSATINRHLAALRSIVKLARTVGMVQWSLDVEGVESVPYRDTKGPGRAGFSRLLDELRGRQDTKAVRDRALLRLLFDLALRRGEVVHIDLEDVDLEAGTVAVLGKKRTEKERLSLPSETLAAVVAWIGVRGGEDGPLFSNVDRAGKGERLTGRSVARIVAALGKKVGLVVRPHGLRHAAITEALELTGGNVRAVQKFSRHRDVRTLGIYDDNRRDLGGEVARLVAASAA